MKFISSAFVASLFAISVVSQNITIAAPKEGNTVSAGSALMVEIDRPNSLTGSSEVAIVIAMNACPATTGCPDPSQNLGTVLYSGSYMPQLNNSTTSTAPHQMFNLTVPAMMAKGQATMNVLHLSLIGAGPFPLYEIKSSMLNIN